jgi:hypothetical protein
MEILLKGAVVMFFTALVMAWLGTFARWFIVKGVDGPFIKDYGLLVKAHIDFLLMSLFCMAFYGAAKSGNIELPIMACWFVVIGGMTNPGVFVIAMLKPDFWEHTWVKIYTAISFILTTAGFIGVGTTIFRSI